MDPIVDIVRLFNLYVGGFVFLMLTINTIIKRYRLRDHFEAGQFGVRLFLLALVGYGVVSTLAILYDVDPLWRVAGLAIVYGGGLGIGFMEGLYLLERVRKKHSQRKHDSR